MLLISLDFFGHFESTAPKNDLLPSAAFLAPRLLRKCDLTGDVRLISMLVVSLCGYYILSG